MPRGVGSVSRYLRFALVAVACWFAPQARAADAPAHLPRYDLDISFETDPHRAVVRERVTWTNRTKNPVSQLAFNCCSPKPLSYSGCSRRSASTATG
jgi:hypothetical protein